MTLPAVILVGGQGTRLRPLTDRTRKDMLPLVDRPLLAYTFEHLARHGVERAIVSCGYLPDQIGSTFGDRHGSLGLEYAVEDEPLGTGGAIAFAGRGLEGSFFALNGDSLREADLGELVRFHRSTGAMATILLTPVADPSRYGLVRLAADGRVSSFLEKPRPEEIDTDLINAGLYVLERSFETEVGEALGSDFTLVDPSAEVHAGARLVPPVFVGAGAVVEGGARVGSLAVVGPGSRLAPGTVVENAVVGARTTLAEGTVVVSSIVGDDTDVGERCEIRNLSVVGPGATLGAQNELDHGLRIGAGQLIPEQALRFS